MGPCSQSNLESIVIHTKAWVFLLIVQLKTKLCDETFEGLWVQAYWWLSVAKLWKKLQQHWHKWQCSFPLSSPSLAEEGHEQVVHPTPQTSMQTKRNPTSQQSPADSQQYKTTTNKHKSIHQLLRKIKPKEPTTERFFCLVCFRQSLIRWQGSCGHDPKMS